MDYILTAIFMLLVTALIHNVSEMVKEVKAYLEWLENRLKK